MIKLISKYLCIVLFSVFFSGYVFYSPVMGSTAAVKPKPPLTAAEKAAAEKDRLDKKAEAAADGCKWWIQLNTDVPGLTALKPGQYYPEQRCLMIDTPSDAFGPLMKALMRLLVNITIATSFLMLVASGAMIAMGWVDKGMQSKWKDLLKKTLIGIALLGLSWLILHTINPNFFTSDWVSTSVSTPVP